MPTYKYNPPPPLATDNAVRVRNYACEFFGVRAEFLFAKPLRRAEWSEVRMLVCLMMRAWRRSLNDHEPLGYIELSAATGSVSHTTLLTAVHRAYEAGLVEVPWTFDHPHGKGYRNRYRAMRRQLKGKEIVKAARRREWARQREVMSRAEKVWGTVLRLDAARRLVAESRAARAAQRAASKEALA